MFETMKIKELIAELSKYDGDIPVVVMSAHGESVSDIQPHRIGIERVDDPAYYGNEVGFVIQIL